MASRVLVLGATGNVGSALVAALASRGVEVAAATRRPGDVRAQGRAVIPVRFDFDDPATFEAALSGADRVFLAVRPGDDDADRTAIPFIDAAGRAGVRHVVALTAMGVERLDGTALRKIERRLEQSGLAWTHLRPNFFMQIFAREPLVTAIRAAGVLRVPAGDAGMSFIDVRDVADVAAAALTAPGHEGRAYTLTGSRAVTHGEVAALLAACTGRPIRYEPLDDDQSRALLSGSGLPPARVERLLGFYLLVRSGWCGPVSPAVASILGRPPRSMAEFVRDYAAVWAPIPPGASPEPPGPRQFPPGSHSR
jgi:uncharacterized protein YbjT (DUF2867 family)